ncbi:MAG TPA: NYN domain-containing protein [Nitrososphaera sp.]|jgi:uncharacterized LabA/DUF88 family protein|nr:NYN domain-containing protein [Nitrososphaera sp.]
MWTGKSGEMPRLLKRVMAFIDGNYLRKDVEKLFGDVDIHYSKLLLTVVIRGLHPFYRGTLVRTYYYDAIPNPAETIAFQKQMEYFRTIGKYDGFEVREGRAIKKGSKGLSQKGVDTLITMDMLSKAYEDQYDAAVLLSGDNDFLDLVYELKDRGKVIIGAFFEHSVSEPLKNSFDRKIVLEKASMEQLIIPKK